jgi:enolase
VKITDIRVRGIFDSRAEVTLEADVTLDGGQTGRGSCPRAIAPGRLERDRRRAAGVDLLRDRSAGPVLAAALVGRDVADERDVDAVLDDLHATAGVGADATLAVSLAVARAVAAAHRTPLYARLAELAGTVPAMPRLLVNVFSGGIHLPGAPDGFQQVMVVPDTGDLVDDIAVACAVYAEAEQLARDRYGEPRLSASSGMVVSAGSAEQVALLAHAIDGSGHTGVASIGVDVAAEHLRAAPGRYRFAGRDLASPAFAASLAALAGRWPLSYLEDPFDPADEPGWLGLRRMLPPDVTVVGDDLYATDAGRVDARLAAGILLKPSQAGTVTGTLDAAVAARKADMVLAVSHRSGETEDTAICDIAVALGAGLIKIGGPRRGDRLVKYNQLLRLSEGVTT